MNSNRHVISLVSLSCGVLASLWFPSSAQETTPPGPAAAEAMTAAQKQPGQRSVGGLGFFSKLVLDGNTRVPEKKLRQALGMDMETVLASHPAANLDDFLPVIARQLERGYRHSGFPAAKVAAAFDPKRDGGRIVVTIREGTCYKMGKILVEGAKEVVPDQLGAKLTAKADDAPAGATLASVIQGSMAPHGKLLPQLPGAERNGAADSTPQPIEQQPFMQQSIPAASSAPSPWKPDSPAEFPEAGQEPHLDAVQYQLATLGRPLARLHTHYALRDDATADLVIRIEDEGPLAVTGRIQIIGATLNTAEEITAAAGLKPGEPFAPGQLDGAVVALWNTGRFFPFAITPLPRGKGAREIDLAIQVVEIPTAPPLSATLPPAQEAARKFICMLNEWAATGQFTDFLIASKADQDPSYRIGFSGRDGLLLTGGSKEENLSVTASISRAEIRCKITVNGRDSLVRLPVPTDRLKVWANLLPSGSGEDGKKFMIGVGCGFSSLSTASERFTIRLAVSPAIALLKPDDFRRDGDEWVFLNLGEEVLRFNLTTGLPVSGDKSQVEFRDGVVREQQQALAEQMAALGETEGVQSWLDAARNGLRLMLDHGMLGGEGKGSKAELEQWNRWLRFGSVLTKPELIKPFSALWGQWTAESPGEETFTIPVDPALLQQFGMMDLLVGFGAVAASEMLAPPDSWVSKLAREMVFFHGGKTQYTARTMQELLADPAMGPYGCVLAARLIGNFDGATAERFLRKARSQATADGFRQDWQLVLNSPTGIGQAVEEGLAALAGIRDEEQQELAAQLDPALAKWFTGFLTRLRELPAAGGLAPWITPTMDGLWNDVLSKNFLQNLERQLTLDVAAAEVIAVVNGQPIPRAWVRYLEDIGQGFVTQFLPELEAWWKEHAAQFGRQGHFHTFHASAVEKSTAGVARATALVRQATALVDDGLPYEVLSAAADLDEEGGLVTACSKDTLPLDLRPECFQSMVRLRPGKSTPVIEMGWMRWLARLEGWSDAPPAALTDEIREQVVAAWQQDQLKQVVARRLAPLEHAAAIQLVEAPAADDPPSVFAAMLETSPDSAVARLGRFWQLARAKDPGAAAALDQVLGGSDLGPKSLKALAAALRTHDHPELADRCKAP